MNVLKKVDTLINIGEGVMFIKSHEPVKVYEMLGDLFESYPVVQGVNNKLAVWKAGSGVKSVSPSNMDSFSEIYTDPQDIQRMGDPTFVLSEFSKNSDTSKLFPYNVLVMQWIEPFMQSSPALVQKIADGTTLLPNIGKLERGKRLIVIVRPDFKVPSGLENIPVVNINLPDINELIELVSKNIEIGFLDIENSPYYSEKEIAAIASAAKGLTAHDAEQYLFSIIYTYNKNITALTADTFTKEMGQMKTELVNKNNTLFIMKPVDIDQIGGLDILKNDMRVYAAVLNNKSETSFKLDKPKGVALFGPPGTGKSMSAQMIAGMLNLPLVRFDLGSVFGSLVGESEKNMRNALELITALSPCVVLVDEVDKVIKGSSNGDSGTSSRVLGQLLTYMQQNEQGTFFVFTANRTEQLPPELLRKGRMDDLYLVGTPTRLEREMIIKIHFNKRNVPVPTELGIIVEATDKLVPAEIEAAIVASIREAYMNNKQIIQASDVLKHIDQRRALVNTHSDDFRAMEEWGRKHAKHASSQLDDYQPSQPTTIRQRSRMGNTLLN